MSTMTLPSTNGSSAYRPAQAWMQSSVQKFFSNINWEDNPPEVQEAKQASSEPGHTGPLSLTMSVSQFFAALNWDGSAIAAPVPQAQEPPQPSKPDEITLDDFSSLF